MKRELQRQGLELGWLSAGRSQAGLQEAAVQACSGYQRTSLRIPGPTDIEACHYSAGPRPPTPHCYPCRPFQIPPLLPPPPPIALQQRNQHPVQASHSLVAQLLYAGVSIPASPSFTPGHTASPDTVCKAREHDVSGRHQHPESPSSCGNCLRCEIAFMLLLAVLGAPEKSFPSPWVLVWVPALPDSWDSHRLL